MKKLLLSTALLSLLFTACKKSDNDEDDSGGIPPGQFKIGATTHYGARLMSGMVAIANSGAMISLDFYNHVLPTSSKKFKVVAEPHADDEVKILASYPINSADVKAYAAGIVAGQTATVKVGDYGIRTVQFHDISARNINDSSDIVQLSANVSEL